MDATYVRFSCEEARQTAAEQCVNTEDAKTTAMRELAECMLYVADPWSDKTYRCRFSDPESPIEELWKFILSWLPWLYIEMRLETEVLSFVTDFVIVEEYCVVGLTHTLGRFYRDIQQNMGIGSEWGSVFEEWMTLVIPNADLLDADPTQLYQLAYAMPDGMAPGINAAAILTQAPLRRNPRNGSNATKRLWTRAWAKSQSRTTAVATGVHAADATNSVVDCAFFSPDGQTILSTGGKHIKFWKFDEPTDTLPLRLELKCDMQVYNKDEATTLSTSAISPNGSIVATGSTDGSIHLYDLAEWAFIGPDSRLEPCSTLTGLTGTISCLVFSREGHVIAAGTKDGSCRLWNVQTAKLLSKFPTHPGPVHGLTFTSDDRHLLSVCEDTNTRMWDVDMCRADYIIRLAERKVQDTTIKLTEARQATETAEQQTTAAEKQDRDSAQKLKMLSDLQQKAEEDGRAGSSKDEGKKLGELQKLCLTTKSNARKAKEHLNECQTTFDNLIEEQENNFRQFTGSIKAANELRIQLDITPLQVPEMPEDVAAEMIKNPTVADEDFDHKCRILLFGEGADDVFYVKTDHQHPVTCIAVNKQGTLMATGSMDTTVRIWDATNWTIIATLQAHSHTVLSLNFDSTGNRLASVSTDKKVVLWELDIMVDDKILYGHGEPINWIIHHPTESKYALTASSDGTVKVWDTTLDPEVKPPAGSRERKLHDVYHEQVRARNARLRHKETKWVQVKEAKEPKGLGDPHAGQIMSLEYSLNGTSMVTGSADWNVKVWDAMGSIVKLTLKEHTDTVSSVVFNKDTSYIFSASHDASIIVWDHWNIVRKARILGHQGPINAIAIHRDDQQLASASDDGTVKVWTIDAVLGEANTNDDQIARKCKLEMRHDDGAKVNDVKFSRGENTNTCASASDDASIRIWDLRDGQQMFRLDGALEPVRVLAYNFRGDIIASATRDGAIRFWESGNGQCKTILPAAHEGSIACLMFTEDGTSLYSVCDTGTANIWDVEGGRVSKSMKRKFKPIQCITTNPKDLTVSFTSGSEVLSFMETKDTSVPNTASYLRDHKAGS